MNRYIRLLRVQQWYKNLVIFLAIFFTNNILDFALLTKTALGFLALCFVSSSYYILNDIKDADEDRTHPEKKKRPIASGEVKEGTAMLVGLGMLLISLALSYMLKPVFIAFTLGLFVSSTLYTFYLKNFAIIDIHVIALNFLIRAVSGAVLISVPASAWLISTVFFMALFLGVAKRRAELRLLGKDAVKHKGVYKVYNEQLLNMMVIVITTALLFTYSLYTFMVHGEHMMLTIPFATFMIFRYLYFISIDDIAARRTEYLFKDKQMVIAFLLWVLTSYALLAT